MCRLGFKKRSTKRPFPPHVVTIRGEIWQMCVVNATNFIHLKKKNKTKTSYTRRISVQTKYVHSDTNCGQKKMLGHHATEFQPYCALSVHRPASAQWKKKPYLSKWVEGLQTETSPRPSFLLYIFFKSCNYRVGGYFHMQFHYTS